MTQTWRFPIILGLSVVFGMPALHDLMMKPEHLLEAGFAYLGALGLSWLGVNLIFSLVDHYVQHNAQARARAEAEALAQELLEMREREAAAGGSEADATPEMPGSASPAPGAAPAGSLPQPTSPPRPVAGDPPAQLPGQPNVSPEDSGLPRAPLARDLLLEESSAAGV